MALFLDRPLGTGKRPGEVDRTPLISYVAFSRAILLRRLQQLERSGWTAPVERDQWLQAAEALQVDGLPVSSLSLTPRPGVVSLADAGQVAADFTLLGTSRTAFAGFARFYDVSAIRDVWSEIDDHEPAMPGALLVPDAPLLRIYDRHLRPRIELGFAADQAGAVGYVERSGVELPARMQVLRVWCRFHLRPACRASTARS